MGKKNNTRKWNNINMEERGGEMEEKGVTDREVDGKGDKRHTKENSGQWVEQVERRNGEEINIKVV